MGEAAAVERVINRAARATSGLGVYGEDDQIEVWARWMARACAAAPDRQDQAEIVARFLQRLAPFTADRYEHNFHAASITALETAWSVSPPWAVAIGLEALRTNLMGVPQVLTAVVTSLAKDRAHHSLALRCVTKLLMPVQTHLPDQLVRALIGSADDLAQVTADIAKAARIWHTSGQRASHAGSVREALLAARHDGLDDIDLDRVFDVRPVPRREIRSSIGDSDRPYDPFQHGHLQVGDEMWPGTRLAAEVSTAADLISVLGRSRPTPQHSSYEAFRWELLFDRVLPDASLAQVKQLERLSRPHDIGVKAQLRLGQALLDRAEKVVARSVLRAAVSTPARGVDSGGWSENWGDTTRREIWRLLVRLEGPGARYDALRDLAANLRSGRANDTRLPGDLETWIEVTGDDTAAVDLWPDIDAYLDRVAPVQQHVRIPPLLDLEAGHEGHGDQTVRATVDLIIALLGHPARALDYGAQDIALWLIGLVRQSPLVAQAVCARLAGRLQDGGWPAEAAARIVVAASSNSHEPCVHLSSDGTAALHSAIVTAAAGDDAIVADLARIAAVQHGLPPVSNSRRPLPLGYRLQTPPVAPNDRYVSDPSLSNNPLNPHSPRNLLEPYDQLLEMVADRVDIPASTLLHQAAQAAVRDDHLGDDAWRALTGADASDVGVRLRRDQLEVSYRPMALMRGRRATGRILTDLTRAGLLPSQPDAQSITLCEKLRLLEPALTGVALQPVHESTVLPWIPAEVYDYQVDWLGDIDDAVIASLSDVTAEAGEVVIAEVSHWHRQGEHSSFEFRKRALVARQGVLLDADGAAPRRLFGEPVPAGFGKLKNGRSYAQQAMDAAGVLPSQSAWVLHGDGLGIEDWGPAC